MFKTPYGVGAGRVGYSYSEGFQHYSVIFPEKGMGVVFLSNSDNAGSIYKELLETTIADTYTPWKWKRYIPYNKRE